MRLALFDGADQKRADMAVFDTRAHHIALIVDPTGLHEGPAAALVNRIVEVDDLPVAPDRRVRLAALNLDHACHLILVIDS